MRPLCAHMAEKGTPLLIPIIVAIILFGLMIFLHELGHFISARAFGVTVHEFALGMGPKIFSFGKKETKYSLRLIPIGGFVRMEGEDEASEKEGSLSGKPAWQRLIILVSGAFMNLLLGLLIFLFLNLSLGVATNEIAEVVPDTPAAAHLEAGDRILKMDRTRIRSVSDVRYFFFRNGGEEVELLIRRGNEKMAVRVTPQKAESGYQLGFVGGYEEHPGFLTALRYSYYDTVFVSKVVVQSLGDLITGKVGLSNMSGPVGIVTTVGEAADQPNWWLGVLSVLNLMGMITVNLGIFNLLPFPALDGGRSVFALLEMIRRKPVAPEKEGWVHAIGFMVLIALMIAVTWSDIVKLFG